MNMLQIELTDEQIAGLRYFAELRLQQGQADAALSFAQDALQRASDQGEQLEIGLAQRMLGQIYQGQGQLAEAKTKFSESLIMLEQQNSPHEIGLTQLALASCYFALFALDQADTALHRQALTYCDQAIAIFEMLGAVLDLQSAQTMRQTF